MLPIEFDYYCHQALASMAGAWVHISQAPTVSLFEHITGGLQPFKRRFVARGLISFRRV